MANKEQTYTIKIDAELSSLQGKVTRAKQLLDGFMSDGKAPKGLVSSFEKLERLLGRISDKSKQAPSKSLFSGVEKDLSNAELLFGEIVRSLDSLKDASKDVKLELFPPESRAQIQAAINGLKEYQKILKELKEKESEVEAARKAAEKAEGAATTAKQSKADIKRKKEKVETKRSSLQGQIAALEADPEKNAVKIAKLKGDITELDLEIKNLTTDYNTATRTLTEANKAATEAKTKYENLSTELEKLETDSLDALSASARKAGREIEEIDGETPRKKMERLNSTMQTFVDDSLAGLPENAQKAKTEMDNYSESVEDATNKTHQAKQADEEYQTALSERKAFEQRIKDFLGMAGAAQLLRSALRDAMSTITELDATMTEMSVVTDLDVSDYWDQLPEYTARANELGLAINDVYKADTLFYQQGLKTNEVVAISTETMKMAKIAGLDTAEATDRMTAALRGFNMEMNETSAQKISDVYSELAAITAADVDEISTAMTKTASIASSAGMEFETTAAFLSQIIETTRESAETAGTAMKTVIARFQELKKAPEDIGEVDGEMVDANAIETALRTVDVELRDSAGQFRELDDVFLELSSKWDGLDKNTQRYIATIAAGSRQQSRFIAMMSDYGRTQDLVTAANNSAGASNRQYQKTMESLETKINKLKNAWHEFTMGILDSDLVKIGVDILTKFLEIVNKGTSAFDGMLGTITKIAGVLAAFKLGSKIFEKIKQPLLDAFSWAAETAGLKGYEAGKNYAKQAKKGAEDQVKEDEDTKNPDASKAETLDSGRDAETPETEKKTLGSVLKDKTGVDDLNKAWNSTKSRKQAREDVKQWKAEAEKRKTKLEDATIAKKRAEERLKGASKYDNMEEYSEAFMGLVDAEKEYNDALEQNNEAQEKLTQSSKTFITSGKEGMDALTTGLSKMGQTAVAAGSALSMIGGMISTLIPGGEEFGELVSGIGQAVTVLGTVLMAIPGIISAIQTILSMPPLGIIVAILTAVLVAIVAIVTVINNNSPEKKLEKAAEEAEKMAEAANESAEAFEKLNDAFNSLDDKYDTLDGLVKGTKEWNKAVRDINQSVLDLIDEYPELAKFVENREGVLTIDLDDSNVQAVLSEVETKKVIAQNLSNMADVNLSDAEREVQFGNLEAVNKVADNRRKETVAVHQGAGTAIGATAGGVLGGLAGAGIGAVLSAILTAGFGTPMGVTGGGAIGAGIGATIFGLIGSAIGTVTGEIAGSIKAGKTATDETLQNAVAKLAEHVSEGGGTDFDSMFDYLHNTMKVSADEAEILAREFSEDLDSLTSYGETVHQIELQQKAVYSQIASSAQNLANTLNMTSEQIKQSSILVDEDVSGEFYEKRMSELADKDMKKLADDADIQSVIRETYGDSAKLDRDSGKVTYIKDGENKEVTLSVDEVKRMAATSYATKESAKAIEYSDDAIRIAGEKLGSNAINALYSANEGGALTQADKDSLVGSLGGMDAAKEWDLLSDSQKKERADAEGGIPPEIKAAWDAMGDAQVAYGGDIVNFMDDLVEGVTLSDKAFEKSRERVTAMGITAQKVVKDFMTADMATAYTKKLEEVAEKAGGYGESGGAAQIDAEVNKILEKYADNIDKQVEIQNRINMADWESKESLLSLQIDLQTQYGYTRAEAEALIQTMSDAAFATSKMTTTVEVFGELQKASDRLNRNLERMAQLQWEYNNALEGGEGNIGELVREQLDTYLDDAAQYQRSFDASKTAMVQVYAQGGDVTRFGGYDLRDFTSLDAEGNLITTNPETGLSLQDLITTNPELEDEIQKWKDSYDSHSSEAQKASEGLRNTLDDIKALEQQGKDAYSELFNMTKEALTSGMQEQIDLQSELLNATKDANSALISQMQAAIDEDRRQRELEKTEENLNSLYSQQAYLAMDTSGMNALQSQELDAQIEQAEQDYQDTLVDQTIQSLQDANARAEEQRERQIAIAEQQLASYQNSDAFLLKAENMMNEMLAADNWMTTELGEKLRDKFMVGMSPEEKKNWEASITGTVDLANVWKTEDWNAVKDNVANTLNSVNGIAEKMGADISGDAANRSVHDKVEGLAGKGYDVESLGYTKNEETKMWEFTGGRSATDAKDAEDKVNKMSMASLNEGTEKEIADLKTSIQKKQEIAAKIHGEKSTETTKYNIASQEEFNKSYNAATGEYEYNGGKYSSYTDYLTKKNSVEVSGYKNLSAMEAYGGAAVSGEIRNLTKAKWNNDKQANFDMKVGASGWDNLVTTSQDYSGDTATKLNRINQDTGGTDIVITKVGGHHGIPGYGDTDHSGGYQLWIKNPNDSGKWRYVVNEGEEGSPTPYGLVMSGRSELDTKKKTYTKYFYETGGLADFTGPAWLDGTPSKPEYVLNAAQTERFFSLVDVLEGIDTKGSDKKSTGDNYFDIEINVEKLENDYDVEQIANKIRRMIYEDATYRNVNAISHIR